MPRTERGRTEPFFADFVTGVWSGGYGRVQEDHSIRTAAQFSGSLFLGEHTLKAGIEYEDNALNEVFENKAGAGGKVPGLILRVGDSDYVGIWSARDITVLNRVLSAFVQSSLRVGKSLRINPGLRWDGQYLVGSDGKVAQRVTNQVQPRIGFTYQPDETGSQKVFGSYGRFYEQMPTFLSSFYHVRSLYYVISYDHNPLVNPAPGDTLNLSKNIVAGVDGLKGEHFDEVTLGYERGLPNHLKFGVRGIYRTVRQVIESIFVPALQDFRYGNPGKGFLSGLPGAQRKYRALELTLEKSDGAKGRFLVSYVLSRNYGNYAGLFDSDSGEITPNSNTTYGTTAGQANAVGSLPNDRRHTFKCSGSYRSDFRLTVGSSFVWQTGAPLSEFAPDVLGEDHFRLVSPRGSAGRTPAIYDLNVRLACDLGKAGKSLFKPRLILDMFHLFSPRKAVTYDQLHYLELDGKGNPINPNANYLTPKSYQPPMSARLGVEVDFLGPNAGLLSHTRMLYDRT